MVAKGHHFAGVELAAVIDADSALALPDFRAEERTFQLLTQLAGRSGRDAPGRVLVQTFQPDARPIAHAARHDVRGFLAEELDRRARARLPARRATSSASSSRAPSPSRSSRRSRSSRPACPGRPARPGAAPPAPPPAPRPADREDRPPPRRRDPRRRPARRRRPGDAPRRPHRRRRRRPAIALAAVEAD